MIAKPYFEKWFHGLDVFWKPTYLYFNLHSIKRNLFECISFLRDFIERGWRGYSEKDIWNLDEYLTRIILGGLQRYKAIHIGYPCIHPNGEDKCKEKFENALDIMIEGFDAARQMENTFDFDEYKKLEIKFNKGMAMFHKYYLNLWD